MRTVAPALVNNLDRDHRPVGNWEQLRSVVAMGQSPLAAPLYISTQGNAIGGKDTCLKGHCWTASPPRT